MKTEVRAQLSETIDKLQDIVAETADDAQLVGRAVRREVRTHPGASVTLALGIGFIAGALIASLRRP